MGNTKYVIPGDSGLIRVSQAEYRAWSRFMAAERRGDIQEKVTREYVSGRQSIRALARKHGCSYGLVRTLLVENNVALRPRSSRSAPESDG